MRQASLTRITQSLPNSSTRVVLQLDMQNRPRATISENPASFAVVVRHVVSESGLTNTTPVTAVTGEQVKPPLPSPLKLDNNIAVRASHNSL